MEHPLFMTSCPSDAEFEKNSTLNALASLIDGESEGGEDNDSKSATAAEAAPATTNDVMGDDTQACALDTQEVETPHGIPSSEPLFALSHLQQTRPVLPLSRHPRRLSSGKKFSNCERDSRAGRRMAPYHAQAMQQDTLPEAKRPARQRKQRATLGQVQIRLALTGL
jgi:hypothetical protein